MPAQRSVVRDDGMRTQQAHAAHAAKRPQSSVPGGQEVRVSDDLAMGSTDESNNETKLTNSEAAGNQGKANIDTGNGMQLKTFTPGVEDVDGMPASKGEGGHSYVQIEGDLTALGGGHQGVEAEDKPSRPDDQLTEGGGTAGTTAGTPAATGEQVFKPDKDTELEAHPGDKETSLFSKAEKGVENIMNNLNVLAKGAANQQVHLKSHREAIVQLKDKFYELKSAILVKMGILKDRLKKMQDGMGTAQEYVGAGPALLPESLQNLKVTLPKTEEGGEEEHKPLQATMTDEAALAKAKGPVDQGGDAPSLEAEKTNPDNVPFLDLSGGGASTAAATGGGQPPVENGGEQRQGLGENGEVDGRADTLEEDDDGPEEEDGGGR